MTPTKVNIELRGVDKTIWFGGCTVEEVEGLLIVRDGDGDEVGHFFLDAVAGWWFEDNPS